MIDILLIIPLAISFLTTLFLLPFWIKKADQIGLVWDDMNKLEKKKVAGSGGIIVILGFLIGVLVFIAYRVFYLHTEDFIIETLSLLLIITTLACVGFVDDLLGWQKGGLSVKSRILLFVLASVPLMVINAGRHEVGIPFLGVVDLGMIYPLILIPLGVVGASSTFNLLAGFNGLEGGQGMIVLSALAIVAFFTGNSWLSIILLCMVLSLLAFLFYNFYPAQIFPGNSITIVLGGLIAITAILGNFEKIAVFFFIPYILEVFLKSRGRLKKESFGSPQKDGTLELRYDKIYGVTHLAIFVLKKLNIKTSEKNIVYFIWLFQIIIILAGFLIFKRGIF